MQLFLLSYYVRFVKFNITVPLFLKKPIVDQTRVWGLLFWLHFLSHEQSETSPGFGGAFIQTSNLYCQTSPPIAVSKTS